MPNTSGRTRISVDFRVVHRADVEAGRGAANVDSHCTGTTMRDYLRVSDLERLPAHVVAPYDAGVPDKLLQYAIYTAEGRSIDACPRCGRPRLHRSGADAHAARRRPRVVGLDAGWYDGCDFGPQPGGYESRTGDIREQRPEDLDGFDAVVNLAAISNDPVGHLNPDATSRSTPMARTPGAGRARRRRARYVFSSSCSLYGAAGDGRSPRRATSTR